MIISHFYNIEKSVCTAFSLNVGAYCNKNNTRFKINFKTYIIMIIFQGIGRAATGGGGWYLQTMRKKCNCHYETKTKY